ncbi:hypothetical protein IC235_18700 [Hymenobacter sp. BT664]|uniref:Lipid/polyisoprenoid-binding YceI-like domain-containing protein n=1 Tax=Hymenobacter montanus TaxID=2771359 RepID=A0A927BGV3_9BACT|nr:hypothetical protein [Hymenobacter montanus]MBD2769924.1 hypothetical protein [Hymenobacter montanus]
MRFLFLAFLILQSLLSSAQQWNTAHEINGSIIKTATGTAAVFNNYKGMGLSFQLNFGKAKATATERPALFEVNGLPLQIIVVQAAPQATSSAEATLTSYISSEVEYTNQSMPAPINPHVASIQIKPHQPGKLWSYALPVGMSNEVEQQVFLNFVHGNFIIGLGSAQFKGQSMKVVEALLLRIARDMQFLPTKITTQVKK